ncbi:MAG: sugar phosphate isomerase/epimerase [Saccharofermentans sp.]|nr:sugar phosphate isomerase/epimerase [Saccharofermentans sp.]
MKLSVSNIAWDKELDESVYGKMKSLGYDGLEIAPTRVAGMNPYEDLCVIRNWYACIKDRFVISSMQSIWYGRTENVFGGREQSGTLIEYTKKAILFAEAIGCKNLVFGCPKNRSMPDGVKEKDAVDFFRTLGEFAASHNTSIGIEANPPIYNTNFLNTTASALDFIKEVGSTGIKLNLDTGTMVENGEDVSVIEGSLSLVNHVHISEPMLRKIEHRSLHKDLVQVLNKSGYQGFVSVEMGKQDDIADLYEVLDYVSGIMQ